MWPTCGGSAPVNEYLGNMFRINFVSLAGPGQEQEIKFLKITYNADGWTWTGDQTHRVRNL